MLKIVGVPPRYIGIVFLEFIDKGFAA